MRVNWSRKLERGQAKKEGVVNPRCDQFRRNGFSAAKAKGHLPQQPRSGHVCGATYWGVDLIGVSHNTLGEIASMSRWETQVSEKFTAHDHVTSKNLLWSHDRIWTCVSESFFLCLLLTIDMVWHWGWMFLNFRRAFDSFWPYPWRWNGTKFIGWSNENSRLLKPRGQEE